MSVSIDRQVAAGVDDARERGNGDFDNDTNYFWAIANTVHNSAYASGARFTNITIPAGSTIDAAYVSIYVYDGGYDDANCEIYMNDVDDADNFDDDQDVYGRDRTGNSASWVSDGVGTGWINSPSLVDAIQEVVDRGGWASGQAMAVLFVGNEDANKNLRAYSYDYNDNSKGPKLHIEYTEGAGAAPRSQGHIIG